MSNIVFYSEPSYYAQEVFIPGLQGASCAGNSCSFMRVRQIFGQSLGYMFLGSVLLLILGFAVARIVLYPLPIRARYVKDSFLSTSLRFHNLTSLEDTN